MLGVGGDVWNWRRRLLAWEEEQVGECCELLTSIVLQDGLDDKWLWKLNLSKSYTVNHAFQLIFYISE